MTLWLSEKINKQTGLGYTFTVQSNGFCITMMQCDYLFRETWEFKVHLSIATWYVFSFSELQSFLKNCLKTSILICVTFRPTTTPPLNGSDRIFLQRYLFAVVMVWLPLQGGLVQSSPNGFTYRLLPIILTFHWMNQKYRLKQTLHTNFILLWGALNIFENLKVTQRLERRNDHAYRSLLSQQSQIYLCPLQLIENFHFDLWATVAVLHLFFRKAEVIPNC